MEKLSTIKLIKPSISQAEIDAVSRVLSSGMIVSGRVVQRFEQMLADYLGTQHAVCVSSGTAALHLALIVADIKPGDEVLVPAFTFPATANVVEMIGAVPVFVDCQPDGVNIDVSMLKERISSRTKAIIPVHAFGIPVELDEVRDIAHEYSLVVVEDAACALGSKYKDKYCGTFGDLATFSFHPRKLLTTGEGGAIVTSDGISAMTLKSLRNHGYEDGDFKYPGYNYRMTDFQAALGVSQFDKFETLLAHRKQLAADYCSMLKDIQWLEVVKAGKHMESNVQTFLVKVNEDINRDSLISHLDSCGIEATIGTYCVPLTHYYRLRYGFQPEEFPEAFKIYQACLSLPLYNDMGIDDITRVVNSLKSYTENKVCVSE